MEVDVHKLLRIKSKFYFRKKKPISRLCCEDYDNLSHVAYNIVLRYSLLTKLFQMYWTELYGRQ